MARVTQEVVKRELVEYESVPPVGGGGWTGWTYREVTGGIRLDVTAFDTNRKASGGYRYMQQVDMLSCGHIWKGNMWWRLRSPAAKRFCQECSDKKTKEIEERKLERIMNKALKGTL